jgi:hypothetical protein
MLFSTAVSNFEVVQLNAGLGKSTIHTHKRASKVTFCSVVGITDFESNKGKTISAQALTRPEGFRRLRFSKFQTFGT